MITPVKPERVLVDRGIGSPFEAITTHHVHLDKQGSDGKLERGQFIGIGVRDDRGFEVFAQPNQLTPI